MKYPRMLTDMVLIEIKKELKTETGIFLPESAIDAKISADGIAVSVGPKCKDIKIGDVVYYKSMIGNLIKDDDLPKNNHYLVVSEKDILGVKELDLQAH